MDTYLKWYKPASQVFAVSFEKQAELLAADTTLDPLGTPVVELHRLVAELPETWEDITDEVVITSQEVIDAISPSNPDCVVMENGAVRFVLESEPNSEDPLPGENYSLLVIANRLDSPSLQVAARVWLHIMP